MPLDSSKNSVYYSGVTDYGAYTHRVVRSGLILNLDASDINSYPGTGTVWYDTSGHGNNGTISGAPTYGIVSGVTCFTFDTFNQFVNGNLDIDYSPKFTGSLEAWFSLTGTELDAADRGSITRLSGGNAMYQSYNKTSYKISNYWYVHLPAGYHESGAAVSHKKWHHVVGVWNNKSMYQWLDGTLTSVSNVYGNSSQNDTYNIGMENSSTRQFAGTIAIIRVYNRALNTYEIAENFQASRGRFGL